MMGGGEVPQVHAKPDDIKRKLREIKKLEIKIRFDNIRPQKSGTHSLKKAKHRELVWDNFFDLKIESTKHVKYPFSRLLTMTKEEFKDALNEYFYHVYYWYYKEGGVTDGVITNPDLLMQFGLPIDADIAELKKKFRELAKQYHPDNGGDSDKFMDIIEKYKNLN